MIKIKVTHARGKQTFKAKGDLLWTVKRTDKEGKDLAPLENISSELCLRHLAEFVRDASSKKVSSTVKSSKKKTPAKVAAKKTPKPIQETSVQSTSASLRRLAVDEDI